MPWMARLPVGVETLRDLVDGLALPITAPGVRRTARAAVC
jgi:hypothetical protein